MPLARRRPLTHDAARSAICRSRTRRTSSTRSRIASHSTLVHARHFVENPSAVKMLGSNSAASGPSPHRTQAWSDGGASGRLNARDRLLLRLGFIFFKYPLPSKWSGGASPRTEDVCRRHDPASSMTPMGAPIPPERVKPNPPALLNAGVGPRSILGFLFGPVDVESPISPQIEMALRAAAILDRRLDRSLAARVESAALSAER